MNSIHNIEKENKKVVMVQSKRTTWNTKRKYNYKYITTVF